MEYSFFYMAVKLTKETKSHFCVERYELKCIWSLKTKYILNNVFPPPGNINFNVKYVIILRLMLHVFTLTDGDVLEALIIAFVALHQYLGVILLVQMKQNWSKLSHTGIFLQYINWIFDNLMFLENHSAITSYMWRVTSARWPNNMSPTGIHRPLPPATIWHPSTGKSVFLGAEGSRNMSKDLVGVTHACVLCKRHTDLAPSCEPWSSLWTSSSPSWLGANFL